MSLFELFRRKTSTRASPQPVEPKLTDYISERNKLRDLAYPPNRGIKENRLEHRAVRVALAYKEQKPQDQLRAKRSKNAYDTIHQTDDALFPVLELLDTLDGAETLDMTYEDRQILRAVRIGASLKHELLIHEQSQAARQIEFMDRLPELDYISLYETPFIRVRWGHISLHDIFFSPSSIRPERYLSSLALIYSYILSIEPRPGQKNPYQNIAFQSTTAENTHDLYSQFPLSIQNAAINAVLMLQTTHSVDRLDIETIPAQLRTIPHIEKAIESYNQLQNQIQTIRNQTRKLLLHPERNDFPVFAEVVEQYLDDPQIEDVLVRELGLSDTSQIKEVYRRINQLVQTGTYSNMYSALLILIDELLENTPLPLLNPPSDLPLLFSESCERPTDEAWTNLGSLQRNVAEELIKTTLRSFKLNSDSLDLFQTINIPLPQEAIVTLDRSNPHTQLHVHLMWNDVKTGKSIHFNFSLNSKRKQITDWSCIADPQDVESQPYHQSVFRVALLCIQQVALHPGFSQQREIPQTPPPQQKPSSPIRTEGSIPPPKDEVYRLRQELRRQKRKQIDKPPPQRVDLDIPPIKGPTLRYDPKTIPSLFTVQVDHQAVDMVTAGIRKCVAFKREPSKFSSKKNIYEYRIGPWRILLERVSSDEYIIKGIEPKRNCTTKRLEKY